MKAKNLIAASVAVFSATDAFAQHPGTIERHYRSVVFSSNSEQAEPTSVFN